MRLGIDFGTTRIVVAAADRGNFPLVSFDTPDGAVADWFPSLAGIRDGRLVYGWDAWQAQADPAATLLRGLKRQIPACGADSPIEVGPERFPLGRLLRGMAEELNDALRRKSNLPLSDGEPLEITLGVPASANSNQRFLTVEAFRQAGFAVLGLLNEPSAASLEYTHNLATAPHRGRILVYDLGGGTFDVSLVDVSATPHTVTASDGLTSLGGEDFDALLAQLALREAGEPEAWSGLSQGERFRILEEARQAKEALHPNTRRLTLDLEQVRPEWPQVLVPAADFYDACRPLVERTVETLDRMAELHGPVDAVYVTGGGSELPLVARRLKETYKTRLRRSPYARAATAIGLAIQAASGEAPQLRDHFTRNFGVWRESDGGANFQFDLLVARGTPLPPSGEPPFLLAREYDAVHNVGHFRYLECSELTESGVPAGEVTLWEEIQFPFDAALAEAESVGDEEIVRTEVAVRVREQYACASTGEVTVTISQLESGFARTFRLGRWRPASARPPVLRRE